MYLFSVTIVISVYECLRAVHLGCFVQHQEYSACNICITWECNYHSHTYMNKLMVPDVYAVLFPPQSGDRRT